MIAVAFLFMPHQGKMHIEWTKIDSYDLPSDLLLYKSTLSTYSADLKLLRGSEVFWVLLSIAEILWVWVLLSIAEYC